nr:hypothetical protein [Streptomyces virginiae]
MAHGAFGEVGVEAAVEVVAVQDVPDGDGEIVHDGGEGSLAASAGEDAAEERGELLRQHFPKGSDLSSHSLEHLAAVAAELNSRPRKRSAGRPQPSVWLST